MTDVPALCFSPVFPCLVLVALSTLQTPAVLPRSRKRLVSLGAGPGPGPGPGLCLNFIVLPTALSPKDIILTFWKIVIVRICNH